MADELRVGAYGPAIGAGERSASRDLKGFPASDKRRRTIQRRAVMARRAMGPHVRTSGACTRRRRMDTGSCFKERHGPPAFCLMEPDGPARAGAPAMA